MLEEKEAAKDHTTIVLASPKDELKTVSEKLSDFGQSLKAIDNHTREIEQQGERVKVDIQFQAELAVRILKNSEKKLLDEVHQAIQQKLDLLKVQKMEAEHAIKLLKQAEANLTDCVNNSQVQINAKTLQQCKAIKPTSFHPIEKPDMKFDTESQQLAFGQLKYSMYSKPILKRNHLYVDKESVNTLLIVKSHDGKPFSIPASLVTCLLVNMDGKFTISCTVKEINPGKFAITCKPTEMGKHHMVVRVGGIQVTGNTFTVPVTKPPEARGTYINPLIPIDTYMSHKNVILFLRHF